jgi:hypothetical protein
VANIAEQDIFVSIAVSDLILRNAICTYIECSAIFATLVAHGPLALGRVLSLAPIGHRGNCRWFQSREAAWAMIIPDIDRSLGSRGGRNCELGIPVSQSEVSKDVVSTDHHVA